jgi:hypothetical protein
MLNYVEWYLVELKLRLEKHLQADRVQAIIDESESHLKLATEARIAELSMSEEQAMLSSIKSFGRPDVIAQDHLRESNPTFLGLKPVLGVLGFGLVALLSWNFAWLTMDGPFDHFGETWQNGIAAAICFVATILFCVACRAGRRSYARPISALGVLTSLVLVILFSWWIVGGAGYDQGVSRFHMARDEAKIKLTIARMNGLEDYFRQGASLFESATSESVIAAKFKSQDEAYRALGLGNTSVYPIDYEQGGGSLDGRYIIPHREIFPMVDGRIWGLEYSKDFLSAKKAWNDNFPVAMRSLRRNREGLQAIMNSINQARQGRLFFHHELLSWPVVVQTMFLAIFLLLMNAVIFRLSRHRGIWPARSIA